MVKVYFESNGYADLVAVFSDENVYQICLPSLEKLAKSYNMIVTESLDDRELVNMVVN